MVAGHAAAAGIISAKVNALTEGVLKATLLIRLRVTAIVILLLTVLGAGAVWLTGLSIEAVATSLPAAKAKSGSRLKDNILGLPWDGSRPGAVLLHGGGRVTDDVFARFVQLAGGKHARIVVVPSANYGPTGYASRGQFVARMKQRFSAWVRLASTNRIKTVEFLFTDNPDDADNVSFVRPLASATGVWFCGGAQARLNYRYVGHFPRRTLFQTALRDVLARGGAVGGTSAGMAALPEIMTLYQGRRRAGGPFSVVAAHGLGLFSGAVVEQHFDVRNGRLERFTDLLRDSDRLDRLTNRPGAGSRMLGLAVAHSTALVLRGNGLEILGNGNTHVFVKSADHRTITWHTLKPGDKAIFQRDSRGNVMLAAVR
jgi:cyanophycinase